MAVSNSSFVVAHLLSVTSEIAVSRGMDYLSGILFAKPLLEGLIDL